MMSIQRKQLWMGILVALAIAAGAVTRMTVLGSHWQPSATQHLFTHISLFAMVSALFTFSAHSWTTRWLLFTTVVLLGAGTEFYEHLIGNIPLETPDVLLDTFGAGCALVFTSAFVGEPGAAPLRVSPQIVVRRSVGLPVTLRMKIAGTRARLQRGVSVFRQKPRKYRRLGLYEASLMGRNSVRA